jgi:hypothetical protein
MTVKMYLVFEYSLLGCVDKRALHSATGVMPVFFGVRQHTVAVWAGIDCLRGVMLR